MSIDLDGASCAGCPLSRRDFLATLALTALVAGCGDGQIGGALGTPTGPAAGFVIRVADYPALATAGGAARVDTASGPVAVVRVSGTSFAAFSMRCPHQGTTVDIRATDFRCPNHGATFSRDGAWTGGQRTSGLASIPIVYDAAAGTITFSGGGPGTPGGGGQGGGGDDDDDDDDS